MAVLRSQRSRREVIHNKVNHERWMVSYADFVTLLFAFFVVMYSMSQVNEAKYKELSTTLNAVFSTEAKALKPIQIGDPVFSATPNVIDSSANGEQRGNGAFESSAELPQLETQLKSEFADLIEDDLVKIDSNELWLQLELKSSVLFASAQAKPNDSAVTIFEAISEKLRGFDNQIQVEGFTDNQAIRSSIYPSNWELSTARAASIVKLMVANGVRPQRLSAVGYGEFQPIGDNTSATGRASNRRVVLMVSRRSSERLTQSAAQAMAMTHKDAVAPRETQLALSRSVSRAAAIAEMRSMAERQVLADLQAEADARTEAEDQARQSLPPLQIAPQSTANGGVLFTSGAESDGE